MGQSSEYEWEDGHLVSRDNRDTIPSVRDELRNGMRLTDEEIESALPVPDEDEALQRALFCRDAAIRLRAADPTRSYRECWREAHDLWAAKPEDL